MAVETRLIRIFPAFFYRAIEATDIDDGKIVEIKKSKPRLFEEAPRSRTLILLPEAFSAAC